MIIATEKFNNKESFIKINIFYIKYISRTIIQKAYSPFKKILPTPIVRWIRSEVLVQPLYSSKV